MGPNAFRVKVTQARWGWNVSIKNVMGLSTWRPTKKWAISAGIKMQAKYLNRRERDNAAEYYGVSVE